MNCTNYDKKKVEKGENKIKKFWMDIEALITTPPI
jgi:hypothetical protein